MVAIVLERGHAVQLETLIQNIGRVDHGRTVGAVLTQPGAGVLVGGEQRLIFAESDGVEALGLAPRHRGDRM